MKIIVYPDNIFSDILEVEDDATEEELNDIACEWVAENIVGRWDIVDE